MVNNKEVSANLLLSIELNRKIHLYKIINNLKNREETIKIILEKFLNEELSNVIIKDGEIQK